MRPEDWWEARHARLVKNEESFRQYNNRRMQQEPVDSEDDQERIPFLCECGDFTCVQALVMTAAEFSDAHAAADRFVVLPGHVFDDVERVVERQAAFEVVEKLDMNVDEMWREAGGDEPNPSSPAN
jgi:hypothetical protein